MSDEQRTLTANFTANSSGFAAGTSEAIQKLKELNTAVVENKQKIKETNSQMKEHQKELEQLKAATNNGATATEAQKKRMQELKDAIAQCQANLGTYQTAQQRLQSEIRNTNSEIDNQRNSSAELSDALLNVGDVIKANVISEAIISGLKEVCSLIQQMATYAYSVGSTFEAAMSQVEAVSGATGDSLEALTQKAKDLGSSTKFTATEAANAMNYMAMAGWDAEEMLDGIDGVLSLAAASGEDLATTADIVTDALTAFGLSASDVGHFSDVLAAASASANTNVSMLGESFKYVAPLAGTLGYSIDDVAEALGIMADSGVKASSAGTYLRTIITNLSSGVTLTADAFDEMEIKAANDDGSMKSLSETLEELRDAFSQMTDEEKVANAEAVAGDRAMSGLLPLLNASTEEIDKVRSAIENCDGAAETMADTMQNNLAGSITVLNSAVEGLGIAVYDKFSDGLNEAVTVFTDAISDITESIEDGALSDKFTELGDTFGDFAVTVAEFAADTLPGLISGITNVLNFIIKFKDEIAAVAAGFVTFKTTMAIASVVLAAAKAITTLKTTVNALKTALTAAATAQTTLNAAMKKNVAGLVATAVATLVSLLTEAISKIETSEEKIERLRESTQEFIDTAEDSQSAVEEIKSLADEYSSLKLAAEQTDEVKERLKAIQDQLIETYGSEANKLDLVNGKYLEQLGILNDLADAKREDVENNASAAYNDYTEAEKEEQKIQITHSQKDYSSITDDVLWNKLLESDYIETSEMSGVRYFKILGDTENKTNALYDLIEAYKAAGYGTSSEFNEMVSLYNQYKATNEENQQVLSTYNSLMNAKTAKSGSVATATEEERKYKAHQAELEAAKKQKEEEEAAAKLSDEEKAEKYKEEKQLADDMYGVGELSAEEYYDKLKSLRDTYLEESTHEWYVATKELKTLSEKLGTDTASDTEDLYKTEKALADAMYNAGVLSAKDYYQRLKDLRDAYLDEGTTDWYNATSEIIKLAQKTGDSITSEYQQTLDAIDAELEKHSRDKEDAEYQEKVDELTARLKYEKLDDYSRKSLEKELEDLNEEWDEVKYQREASDAKDAYAGIYSWVQDKMSEVQTGYDPEQWANELGSVFSGISENYSKNSSSSTTTNDVYNIIINGTDKTTAQIVNEVKSELTKGLT